MILINVIECRSAVLFLDRSKGLSGGASTSATCGAGTVEACLQGELLLQAMAGDGYDPDIRLTADNDNSNAIGPIRECSHTAIIYAGA